MGKIHLHAISKNGSLCNTYAKKLSLTLYKAEVTCKLCMDILGIFYPPEWPKKVDAEMKQAAVDFKDVMLQQTDWEKQAQDQEALNIATQAKAKLKPIHQVFVHIYKSPTVNRVNRIWNLKKALVERNKIDNKIEEAKIEATLNNIVPYGGRTKRYACRPDCDVCKSRGLKY